MAKLKISIYTIAIFTILFYVSSIAQAFSLPKLYLSIKEDETLFENRIEGNRELNSRTKRQLNIIQSKIADIVHPKPIVDTIREEEKYGNTVDHRLGKSIVKAVENLSNVINAVFAFPIDTVKKASRTATEALNNIGGKLVGLQK